MQFEPTVSGIAGTVGRTAGAIQSYSGNDALKGFLCRGGNRFEAPVEDLVRVEWLSIRFRRHEIDCVLLILDCLIPIAEMLEVAYSASSRERP